MHLLLPGDVPSKKNSKRWLQRGRKRFLLPSQAYEDWHEEQMLRIRRLRPKKPFSLAAVRAVFYPRTRVRGDLTNKMESVMDLLVDAQFIEDDNWFVIPDAHPIFGGVDPKNPRVEIEINPLQP